MTPLEIRLLFKEYDTIIKGTREQGNKGTRIRN